MAGPWEAYQPKSESEGPWSAYQSKPPREEGSVAGKVVRHVMDAAMPFRKVAEYGPDVAFGAKQAWDAGAQMLSHAVPDSVRDVVDKLGGGETADQHAVRSKAEYERNFTPEERGAGADVARGFGQTLPLMGIAAASGPVAATGLVANAVTKIPAAVRAIAGGAGSGGSSGVLTPVYEQTDQFWKEKGKQGGTGAAVGAATGGALHGAANVITPHLSAAQRALSDRGISLSPGQALGGVVKGIEDRIAGFPVIGELVKSSQRRGILDFNKAMYSEATKNFGKEGADVVAKASVGHKGIEAVGDFLSGKYEAALAKSIPSPMDDAFMGGLSKLQGMVPTALEKDFAKTINREILDKITPGGTITPSVAKEIDSFFKAKAAQYTRSSDAAQQELGQAYREVASQVRQLFARNNPTTAPLIRSADDGWATLVQIERAGGYVGAKDGVFTPAQFVRAVKAGAGGTRGREFARGNAKNQEFAEQAKDVLSNEVPDSGTAGRLAAGAAAANLPATLGMLFSPAGAGLALASVPYLPGIGPMIMRAAQSRGATSLGDLARRAAPALGAPAGALALQQ